MIAADESSDRRYWITLSVLCLPVVMWAVLSPATIMLVAPWHVVAMWGFLVAAVWSVVACALAPVVSQRDCRTWTVVSVIGIHCVCLVFSLFWVLGAQLTSM